jgi:hypothetical protein
MKTKVVSVLVLLLTLANVRAADWFEGITVSPFVSYRIHQGGDPANRLGGGLAAAYSLSASFDVEASVLSESLYDDPVSRSFTEADLNLKGYLPIRKTALSLYGILGYSHHFKSASEAMNIGGGLRLGRKYGLGAEAVWREDFHRGGQGLLKGFAFLKF